jgi:hypothetical protein
VKNAHSDGVVRAVVFVLSTLAITATVILMASVFVTAARADDMGDMPGMSAATPTPAPTAMDMSGDNGGMSSDMPGMTTDEHAGMDMGGSVNWLVVGGALAIVVGATIAAAALKSNLRHRTLAGEFAGAGAQDD